ncbi:hypothetical protein N658DRAFT_524273 [Parathielavia hyrcaniae]|uniref:Sister chromatid cohesion protein Ctf8 n=1 Tax=Parathielavia hyrcaniae TaxID=113614 RepID=A0AAN6T197_9PEZI|nr:hypothetical protein N658DRAFT_524273 [Parathielavia hyrcaniae]
MPSPIPLHPRRPPAQNNLQPQSAPSSTTTTTTAPNPLPPLLQTPSGLALLELQGTFNLPPTFPPDATTTPAHAIPIGRVHFPEYRPDNDGNDKDKDTAWMKRVWMYVGEHQRLQGEVRKLPRAVAVLRRRTRTRGGRGVGEGEGEGEVGGEDRDVVEEEEGEELEVAEIVRYKIVFSSRPEPVGSGEAGLSG